MVEGKKNVKVIQIASGLSTEGIGTFLLNTYENISQNDLRVSFALATDWKQYYEQRILDQGAKVYRTAEIGKGLIGIIKHVINLIQLLKKEGPFDVVHSHMDFFNGINLLAAYIARVPIRISHAHIATSDGYISMPKKFYNSLMILLINLFATHKLGCSEKANQYMHRFKWKDYRNKVLLNGIDLIRFSKNKDLEVGIGGLKVDQEKINFITIGRIDDPKNPFFIVGIIKELKNIRDDIHLYWVGSGSLEKEVKELVGHFNLNENITFLGIRNDIAEILSLMDFMLFPSKWEGLGIVLVEAQASGVPCFISDTITPEVNVGLCTVLSLSENEETWARKIDHYINNHNYNNQLEIEKLNQFDIKSTVKTLEQLYMYG